MDACAHCLHYYQWRINTTVYYVPIDQRKALVRWRLSWFRDHYSRLLSGRA